VRWPGSTTRTRSRSSPGPSHQGCLPDVACRHSDRQGPAALRSGALSASGSRIRRAGGAGWPADRRKTCRGTPIALSGGRGNTVRTRAPQVRACGSAPTDG
jgi:hypothetical protein